MTTEAQTTSPQEQDTAMEEQDTAVEAQDTSSEADAEVVADAADAQDGAQRLGPDGIPIIAIGEGIIDVLRTIYDPEIPVDIYELGLIYDIDVDEAGKALIQMTLTSPACPVAGSLPGEVEEKVRTVAGVTEATVEIVWDPPWTPEMMSEDARLELGFW